MRASLVSGNLCWCIFSRTVKPFARGACAGRIVLTIVFYTCTDNSGKRKCRFLELTIPRRAC